MDHEISPDASEQEPPAEPPKEWPEPTQSEIDEAEQEERAREVYEREQRVQQLLDSTPRMIEISEANEAERRAAEIPEPAPTFEPPARVQAALERQEKVISDEFDRMDEQAWTTGVQISKRLAEKGLAMPKTAEEIEAEEVAKIRAHAEEMHKPRVTKSKTLRRPPNRFISPRDTGPPKHITEQMRDDN